MVAEISFCVVCLETSSITLLNKLLTSCVCGHKVCKKCLSMSKILASGTTLSNGSLEEGNSLSSNGKNDSKVAVIPCPVCKVKCPAEQWEDHESEYFFHEHERLTREHVQSIYNLTRTYFENTPQYNDFLERREETIYTLIYSDKEEEKRKIQEEMEAYELDNQKIIASCKQELQVAENDNIRSIVSREGTFYEVVQESFDPGFRYKRNLNLIHPLKRNYPTLFQQEKDELRENDTTSTEVIGAGKHPKPLEAGLVYNKIPKNTESAKVPLLRASGFSQEKVTEKFNVEWWEGVRHGVSLLSSLSPDKAIDRLK